MAGIVPSIKDGMKDSSNCSRFPGAGSPQDSRVLAEEIVHFGITRRATGTNVFAKKDGRAGALSIDEAKFRTRRQIDFLLWQWKRCDAAFKFKFPFTTK